MNSESIAEQLLETGLFIKSPAHLTENAPFEALVNAEGHGLLARLGWERFREEVEQRSPGCKKFTPGWTLGTVGQDFWPIDELRRPGTAPPVLSHLFDASAHRLLLRISPDLSWFDGHFPDQPILAGVVQIHLAVLLARNLFDLDGYPREITRIKFQRPVVPPRILELSLVETRVEQVRFSYCAEGSEHSQGRLQFRSQV